MKTRIASALIVLSNGLAWPQTAPEPAPETAFTTPIIFPERSQGVGMAIDSARNVHALALREGNSFSLQVVKLSPRGDILWSRNLRGTPNSFNGTSFLFPGNPGIAVDGSGNSYVAATDLFGAGGVLFKIDADGNVTGPVQVPLPGLFPALTGIAFDPASGHLYVAGTFTRPGTLSSPAVGSVLAAEYGPDLARLNTALFDDGPAAFDASGPIAADGSGNVYVGVTQEGVFPNRDNSWLVAKFTPHLGQRLQSSPFLTDRFFKFLRGLAAGLAGSVYAVGERDTAFTTVGSMARLDGAGGVMVFPPFQSPGTNPFDLFSNVKADAAGNAYVAGFSCAGVPKDCFTRTLKYSPAGEILWTVQLPGDFFTDYGIDVDAQKGVYLAAGGRPDALAIKYQQAGAQNTVSIGLSGSSIQPVINAPNAANKATVTAHVEDANHAPVAGAAVNLKAAAVEFSGGHQHDGGRPTGVFEVVPATNAIAGKTDTNGDFMAVYVSTFFGGLETITAQLTDTPGISTSAALEVRVPGLQRLPDNPAIYTKTGGTQFHVGPPTSSTDSNHYGTEAFNAIISSVSAQFKEQFPNREVRINDMSLPRGGLFDIGPTGSCFVDFPANTKPCKFWQRPHKFHRLGTSCDYNLDIGLSLDLNTDEDLLLQNLFDNQNVSIWQESNHWHVYLQGGGP